LSIITQAPGDVIFTGMSEGISAMQGKFLTSGDVIATLIEGIGTLRNVCR
jgi:2-keto-4-pentenoate hydratase/2-oxohepta-3-ene-1,7-dioic acid hydratase in catechol pathway